MPLDRSRPPGPGPLRPFSFPEFTRQRLAPGLELCLLPRAGVPLLFLELIIPRGADGEDSGIRGLATLTASLLDEGTRRRGALEIATAIEELGGQLGSSADWDGTYLSTTVGSEHLEEAFALLAEVASEPVFPEREVDRLRRQRLAELQRRSMEPDFLAARALARSIYGQHVFGETLLGRPEGIAALTRADVVRWYEEALRPTRLVVVAVGRFDGERLRDLVLARFAEENRGEPAAIDLAPPARTGVRVLVVDRPDAPQTELRIGHAGVPVAHPDRPALQVANALLGGKFTSRINLSLRERLGVTYGAYSRWAARRGPGPFVVGAAVASTAVGTAAQEILAELERLRQEHAPAAEVEDGKSYLVGTFPYTLQTLEGLAARLEEILLHGLPDDYFRSLPTVLGAVDPGSVQRAASAHLRPAEAAVIAVGPAKEVAPQLAALGEVSVLDGSGER